MEQVKDAFTDLQRRLSVPLASDTLIDVLVYAFELIQLLTTFPRGGIGAFANIIVSSFGHSTWQSQLLFMVVGAVISITMLNSAFLDRKFRQTIYTMMLSVIPSILGTSVLIGVLFSADKKPGILIAYFIFDSIFAVSSLSPALLSRNLAGQTKKSVIIAFQLRVLSSWQFHWTSGFSG